MVRNAPRIPARYFTAGGVGSTTTVLCDSRHPDDQRTCHPRGRRDPVMLAAAPALGGGCGVQHGLCGRSPSRRRALRSTCHLARRPGRPPLQLELEVASCRPRRAAACSPASWYTSWLRRGTTTQDKHHGDLAVQDRCAIQASRVARRGCTVPRRTHASSAALAIDLLAGVRRAAHACARSASIRSSQCPLPGAIRRAVTHLGTARRCLHSSSTTLGRGVRRSGSGGDRDCFGLGPDGGGRRRARLRRSPKPHTDS